MKVLSFLATIMISISPPSTRAKHIRKMNKIVENGDIICRRYDCYLSNLFIPEKYSHSGLVIDKDTVIDSTSKV